MKALHDPQGALAEGLGAIRTQFQVPPGFPPQVLAMAKAAAQRAPTEHVDRTSRAFVTLDPATSTDLDQAFAIERAGADIVLCASNSLDPIFFEHWIEPGMHLSSIKKPEIDPAAIKAATRVVVHTHDTEPTMVVAKNAKFQEASKGEAWNVARKLDFKSFPTLPEMIAGGVRGRESETEVTCFLNNLGLGYQFAAAGSVIYRRAMEQGAGHALPTDWFTETVHP